MSTSKKISAKKTPTKKPTIKKSVVKKPTTKKLIVRKMVIKNLPVKKITPSKSSSKKPSPSVFGPDLQKRIDYAKGNGPKMAKSFDELRKENPMMEKIGAALNEILDPEIGIGIVDLGLIYGANLEKLPDGTYDAVVIMTLTSMGCPVGPMIMEQVQTVLPQLVPEITSASVQIVWDPPWGPDKVKPEIRDMLFGF